MEHDDTGDETILGRDLGAIGRIPYPEQLEIELMLERVRDAGDGMVILIEAPTASGKTHAMASHALDMAVSETEGAVVLAAPTIETCRGAIAAIDEFVRAVPAYRDLTARLILGRGEFVSHDRVVDLSTAYSHERREDLASALTAWLDAGGPGVSPTHPRYTRHGLIAAMGDDGPTPPDWISLDSAGPNDAAEEAYRSQFAEADVVVATHAMLARDLVKRWIATSRIRAARTPMRIATGGAGWQEDAAEERVRYDSEIDKLLPEFRRLIVDEAHLLPGGIRSALSTSVSVKEIVSHLEDLAREHPRSVPAESLRRARDARAELDRIGDDRDNEPIRIDWLKPRGMDEPLRELKAALDLVKPPKGGSATDRPLTRARLALREAITYPNSVTTTLSWSPSRRYPSFSITPNAIGPKLAYLWKSIDSAALLSATLFTEKVEGPDATYMKGKLRIPPDAILPSEPIRTRSGSNVVSLVMVTADEQHLRVPPKGDDDQAWIDALAARIVAETTDEMRGTLVLTTSTATTEALSASLIRAGISSTRIFDGSTMRIVPTKPAFEQACDADLRPIWVSHGAAWTGLDIRDDALGTVVITRIPHLPPLAGTTSRDEPVFAQDAIPPMMMMLKQGVGRLVRSRNPRPKRLVFLDPRIHNADLSSSAYPVLKRLAE